MESGCSNQRDQRITTALLSSVEYVTDFKCQQVFICLLENVPSYRSLISSTYGNCESILHESSLHSLAVYCRLEWIIFPEYPILFGLFQFVYFTNRTIMDLRNDIRPDLICFNASRCPRLLSCSIDTAMRHNGYHCCQANTLIDEKFNSLYDSTTIFEDLIVRCLTIGTDKNCSHPSLFHCLLSSKCISKHRLVDGTKDCYYAEDESFAACQLNDSWRFSCQSESNKCLSIVAMRNGKDDCPNGEDEWTEEERNIRNEKVSFGYLCDSKNDWLPIDGLNETDETHCD